jgi:thiamine-monophosphate kinase
MAHGAPGGPLGEFERVRRFFAPLSGPGGLDLLDDAAIVDCRAGQRLVVTADAIVAGVHYLPDDPPGLVARKLLRVNLSDLAAMGARPLHYLLTTALPTALGADWVAEFARGLAEDQRRFGIDLLGGDSVATSGPAVLSLTAIGEVAAGMEIRRSGARAGDLVWVSGTIGDACLGLALLRGAYPQLAPEYRARLIARFQIPDPRVDLGRRLAGIAHAMIDISDGLIADLAHICETSCVAAIVELASLPLSPAARIIVDGEPGVRTGLAAGGDDYELLFTAPAASTKGIDALSSVLGLPITRIGKIEPGEGVRLVDADGRTIPVDQPGYRHF